MKEAAFPPGKTLGVERRAVLGVHTNSQRTADLPLLPSHKALSAVRQGEGFDGRGPSVSRGAPVLSHPHVHSSTSEAPTRTQNYILHELTRWRKWGKMNTTNRCTMLWSALEIY